MKFKISTLMSCLLLLVSFGCNNQSSSNFLSSNDTDRTSEIIFFCGDGEFTVGSGLSEAEKEECRKQTEEYIENNKITNNIDEEDLEEPNINFGFGDRKF